MDDLGGARPVGDDGVVTMSAPMVHPPTQPWSIDDLKVLPDDGMRYELVDGSLLVSPHAGIPHGRVANQLRRVLDRQVPDHLFVGQDLGVRARNPRTYFVPVLWVVRVEALRRDGDYFEATEVKLVVEVLSDSNAGVDLILKRHYYADAGIPEYWIVDRHAGSITVLRLDGATYTEAATMKAGHTYQAQTPFPLAVDPADVF